MKALHKLLLLTGLSLLYSGSVSAQCTNASQFPSTSIDLSATNSSGATTTITSCNFSGEYSALINAVAGNSYRFTSTIATDYFTIRSGSPGGPVVGSGTQPLTVTPGVSGNLYAHINSSSACSSDLSCRQTAVQCTSCASGGCVNSTVYPSLNISLNPTNTSSAVQTITTCQFGGEYYSVIDVIANKSYTFSSSVSTDWITVRVGVFNGTILGQGAGAVTVTPSTTSTLFIHNNSNASCGTNSTCRVSSVQCTNCTPPCNAPGTPSASNISTTSATVNWGAAMGATSYDWTVGTGASCPTGSGANTAATSVNLTGLTPNTTYRFCVRTSTCGGGDPSSYVSTTFTTAPLANDNCSGAPTVSCGQTVSGSTVGAASDAGAGQCGDASGPNNGVWYKITGNGAQIALNLCGSNYDTQVHVYSGSCGNLVCVGSNDDSDCGLQSEFAFNSVDGQTYYILINGFGSATGAFTMSISCDCGPNLGYPWTVTNIGPSNGSAIENVCGGTIDVKASNYGSPSNDVQTFAWQILCGNGSVKAKLENVTNGGWGGIMYRENNTGGSKKIALRSQLTTTVIRDLRAVQNGVMQQQQFPRPNTPMWLRLTRNGNVFTGETSLDGVNWDWVFFSNLVLPECVEVGLFAQSINVNVMTTASFSNVMLMGEFFDEEEGLVRANNNNALESIGFSLFPNPAKDEVNIKLPSYIGKQVQIAVYNNVGQAVIVREIDEVQDAIERLPLTDLSTGVYFVTVRSEGVPMQTQKLIVGSPRP